MFSNAFVLFYSFLCVFIFVLIIRVLAALS